MARKETPFRFWPPWRNPSSWQRPPAPPARTPPPSKPTPSPVPPQSQPPLPSVTAPSPPSSPSRPSQPASPPPSPVPPRSQPSPPREAAPSPPSSPRSSQLASQEDSKAQHESSAQWPMPASPERPPPSSTPPPSPVPPRSRPSPPRLATPSLSSSSRLLQPESHEDTKERHEGGAQGPMPPPSPEQPPPSSTPPLPVLPRSQPLSPLSSSRSQPASREKMEEQHETTQGPMPLSPEQPSSLQESRRPLESEEHKIEAKENDDAEQRKKLSLMEKQETKRAEERAQRLEEQELSSTKPREPITETTNEENEAERPSTSGADDANKLVANMKISTGKQEEEENTEEAAPRKEKLYIPISHAPLSDFSHGAGRPSYQAQIKDATSKLVQKLNIGISHRPGNVNGVEVITLAGENKGAAMTLSFDDEERHNSRNGGRSSGESSSVINSNVQSINNSLLQESSCSEINAGVHLIGVAKDGVCCKRRMQMNNMPRALSQQKQQQPAIRRRCLRGLFAEPSDGEEDVVPQRHGCRFCAIDKKKDKAEAQ